MPKSTVVYPCNEILLNNGNGMTHGYMQQLKPQKHYTKCKKLHRGLCTVRLYLCRTSRNSKIIEADQRLPGADDRSENWLKWALRNLGK